MESALTVRWNLLSTVGFLGLVFGITWLTNQVWFLPEEASWFSLLALGGHAFVSAVLLASSYAYYQGRRDWVASQRELVVAASVGGQEPPEAKA
jgi:hypothetical protein